MFNFQQNPMSNMTNFMNSFNNFKQSLGNNPSQYAEQMVKQMLNTGQVSQEQFNQVSQMATMLQKQFNL